jgi:hypothetical protein
MPNPRSPYFPDIKLLNLGPTAIAMKLGIGRASVYRVLEGG